MKIVAGINRPWGVAVDKEQLIVAEHYSYCITVYDKEGKKIRSFGSKGTKDGQFTDPCGVAVTNDGHILVTDNHRLQKLTPEGCCVMSVGSSERGSGPLQFDNPVGIAIHPTTGQIFVADHGNHRIQVINGDFTYSHSIGRLYTDLEVLQQFGNRGRSPRFPNCCNTDKEVCNRFILRSIVTHVAALFSCDADGISTCCMYCKIAEVSILFGNSLL